MKGNSSGSILYREWVPTIIAIKVAAGSLIVLDLALMAVFALTSQSLSLPLPLLILIFSFPLFLLGFMAVNYRGIDIRITPTEVRVRYGVVNRKRIYKEEILGCEVIKASFRRYGGIGVRYGFDGTWAYTAGFGPAVKLSLAKGRPFVFSSKYPEKICTIIEELTAQDSTPPT